MKIGENNKKNFPDDMLLTVISTKPAIPNPTKSNLFLNIIYAEIIFVILITIGHLAHIFAHFPYY